MEIFKLFGSILVDTDEAERSISRTEKKAEGVGGKFKAGIATAAKWGTAIVGGATLAAGALGALAAPLVRSAADAQAMNAQFEQVFGDMQAEAQKSIESMGQNFGMLPNRIKPAMSMMTSMFKGLGMDTEEAMSTAEEAVTLTADAAAFYDKSFEDANSALNSFIKGNYEGGESIGLFANETQLATYAADELGLEWKNLDEAGKQVARLEYAKAMQDAAGATGQASRESGSLENQLGNLRQAWEDIKAKFGAPILEPAVTMIQNLSAALSNVDVDSIVTKIESFATKAMEYFGIAKTYVMETLIPTFQSLYEQASPYIENFKLAISRFIDLAIQKFNEWKPIVVTVLTEIVTFVQEKLATIKQFWDENGAQIILAVQNFASMLQSIFQFLMPAILFIVEYVWGAIKNVISGALDVIMGVVKIFTGIFTGDFSKMWEGVKQLFSGAINLILGIMSLTFLGGIRAALGNLAKAGLKILKTMWDDIVKAFLKGKDDAIANIRNLKEIATTTFQAIKSAIMKPIDDAVAGVKSAIGKIKGFFSGLKLSLPKIKMPSFSIKNWSMNPADWIKAMPKLTVSWNKLGGIFTQPTIFNTANAGLQGVGEAGPEAILPLNNNVLGSIGRAIAEASGMNMNGGLEIVVPVYLDGREVAKGTYKYTSEYQDRDKAIRAAAGGRFNV